MIVVNYECLGRLGNNIFQFLASMIFAKKVGGIVLPPPARGNQPFVVNDDTFLTCMAKSDEALREYCEGKSVFFHGYFQRGEILVQYKDVVVESMQSNLKFNQQIHFRDLFVPLQIPPDVCIIHLRLDDFNFQHTSNVVHYDFYIEQIEIAAKMHSYDKFAIIVDKPKLDGERKYLQKLTDALQTRGLQYHLHSGQVIEDWNLLRVASYVISSNSTFAFMACLYGLFVNPSKRVVYPQTGHYPHQMFAIELEGWKNVDVSCIDFMKIA